MNSDSRISLTPTASDVARFNLWLDAKYAESGIEKQLAADLKLCLNEVLANLINYGFKDTPDPLTVVALDLKPGRASATVTDNGVYFDIRKREPAGDRDLMTGDAGGFGIMLVKERASKVFYTRIGDLNHLIVVCERA